MKDSLALNVRIPESQVLLLVEHPEYIRYQESGQMCLKSLSINDRITQRTYKNEALTYISRSNAAKAKEIIRK